MDHPAFLFGDKNSAQDYKILQNSSLRNMSNDVDQCHVQEKCVCDDFMTPYISTEDNLVNLWQRFTFWIKKDKFFILLLHNLLHKKQCINDPCINCRKNWYPNHWEKFNKIQILRVWIAFIGFDLQQISWMIDPLGIRNLYGIWFS